MMLSAHVGQDGILRRIGNPPCSQRSLQRTCCRRADCPTIATAGGVEHPDDCEDYGEQVNPV